MGKYSDLSAERKGRSDPVTRTTSRLRVVKELVPTQVRLSGADCPPLGPVTYSAATFSLSRASCEVNL